MKTTAESAAVKTITHKLREISTLLTTIHVNFNEIENDFETILKSLDPASEEFKQIQMIIEGMVDPQRGAVEIRRHLTSIVQTRAAAISADLYPRKSGLKDSAA